MIRPHDRQCIAWGADGTSTRTDNNLSIAAPMPIVDSFLSGQDDFAGFLPESVPDVADGLDAVLVLVGIEFIF